MSTSRHPFYSPLDQSQIEFIPSDLDSTNYSYGGFKDSHEKSEPLSDSKSSGSPSLNTKEHSSLNARRGSVTISELIFNNISRSQTNESHRDDAYALSRMTTTTSLTSNVIDRVRYKIMLKLNSRERQLIRESWAMILNEDVTSTKSKTKQPLSKGFKVGSLVPVNSQVNNSRRNSISSVNNASNVVPETKGNAQSNAFASSLFCSQFYANLLSMDPGLERMFPSIRHQAVAFAGVLTTAVKNLENLQALENYLTSLGKRHARILGIEPPHFELMGVAFLKTLQDRFGIHCTIELEEVWSRLYSYLANSILQFGIDPFLQIDLNQDTLVFPVPDLQTGASRTVSRLSSHISLSESHATSHNPSDMVSSATDHWDRAQGARLPKDEVKTSSKKAGRSGARNKASSSKSKGKKTSSKLTLSSNQDCIVM